MKTYPEWLDGEPIFDIKHYESKSGAESPEAPLLQSPESVIAALKKEDDGLMSISVLLDFSDSTLRKDFYAILDAIEGEPAFDGRVRAFLGDGPGQFHPKSSEWIDSEPGDLLNFSQDDQVVALTTAAIGGKTWINSRWRRMFQGIAENSRMPILLTPVPSRCMPCGYPARAASLGQHDAMNFDTRKPSFPRDLSDTSGFKYLSSAALFGNSYVTDNHLRRIRISLSKFGMPGLDMGSEMAVLRGKSCIALEEYEQQNAVKNLKAMQILYPEAYSALVDCHLEYLDAASPLVKAMYVHQVSMLDLAPPGDPEVAGRLARDAEWARRFMADVARVMAADPPNAESASTRSQLISFVLRAKHRNPIAFENMAHPEFMVAAALTQPDGRAWIEEYRHRHAIIPSDEMIDRPRA